MHYDDVLKLLQEILSKLLIPFHTVSPAGPLQQIFDDQLKPFTQLIPSPQAPFHKYIGFPKPGHIYKSKDRFSLRYVYFLLPDATETVFFIGPYITEPIQLQDLLEIEEKEAIPPKLHKLLLDYFSSLPIISDQQHLFITIEALAERIWSLEHITVIDNNLEYVLPASPINTHGVHDQINTALIDMSIMERRYRFENELMESVSLGQISKAELFLDFFPENPFEKRLADPLRNLKNYCIIMNTLLRKAAENGGVHPMYLDNVSSDFAAKIERLSAVSDGKYFMQEMFRAYCRLVRKHSMKDYSSPVRKAIIMIESDLSADLSLSTIAKAQGISAGYLSSIFKKETGSTLTEFITEKRIRHATHLLHTTNLQIQTIALHCGIMDAQYFSKLYKKLTGVNPSDVRTEGK